MSAVIQNIWIDQGASFDAAVTMFLPDKVTPFNLGGYTAKAQIKTSQGNKLALEFVVVIPVPASGVIEFSALPVDTAKLDRGKSYSYDVRITNGIKAYIVARGSVYVNKGITS